MKKIYLVLILAIGFLSTATVTAQTSVTSSGMSIQGIARDINNEALANIDQLDLKFEVYYLIGASTTPTIILTALPTVKTDNFGVFSYVLSIDQDISNLISTQSAYLRVSSVSAGNPVFSDEKLQTVPYSIYAQNGVPTGSVMPYLGTTAPNGWLLCDGTVIPSGIIYDKLKTLLGSSYTPDLRAMFLRGAGTGNGKVGPTLKQVVQDDIKEHLHDVDINTSYDGNHTHNLYFSNDDYSGSGGGNSGLEDDTANIYNISRSTSSAGSHNHYVKGKSANTGGTETRPINYGVNYIIKI